MPPKGSTKSKVKEEKETATPVKSKSKAKAEPETPKPKKDTTKKDTPAKTQPTPKKKDKIDVDWKPIPAEAPADGPPMQITVTSDSETGQGGPRKKLQGCYMLLNLEAPNAFSVPKTILITEGPYEGMQAILIRPAKAFQFAKLPDEVRNRIYRFYLAPKGIVDDEIVLDGKRTENKECYAKTYADKSKSRVALLAVNKQFGKEATDVFYAHTLRFDSSATVIDFISQVPSTVRPRLQSLSIKNYNKTTARNAMHFLAEATNIQQLRFDQGVFNEGDPKKAAKVFHGDAYKFLEAIGTKKGDKTAGVEVLRFGKESLMTKDEKKQAKPWSDDFREEFLENLRKLLRGEPLV